MRPNQLKILQKDIKSFLNKHKKDLLADQRSRNFSRLFFLPVLFVIYNQAVSVYIEIKSNGFSINLSVPILHFLTILGLAGILIINASNPPKEKGKVEKWLWEKGQKRTIIIAFIFLLQTLTQLLDEGVFGTHRYYVAITYFAFLIYLCCVLSIVINPKMFFSKIINLIGTMSFVIFIGYLPIRLIILFGIKLNDSVFLWMIPAIIFLFWVFNYYKINIVQLSAIQIINPDKLFSNLRSTHRVLKDQYNALQIKADLEKDISLGVKTELIKLYASEYNEKNKKPWLVAIIISLSIFILSSLGEAFFQDILYESFIKPTLCNLFSILCNS